VRGTVAVLLASAVLALGTGGDANTVPSAGARLDPFPVDFLQSLPGSWRIEALRANGRAIPAGRRTFSRAFATAPVLSWEEWSENGELRGRGFVGATDTLASRLFYLSVLPGAPPIAITGRPDAAARSIHWELVPAAGPDHLYNQDLVPSRMQVLSADAFDWMAEGHWHLRFRRSP